MCCKVFTQISRRNEARKSVMSILPIDLARRPTQWVALSSDHDTFISMPRLIGEAPLALLTGEKSSREIRFLPGIRDEYAYDIDRIIVLFTLSSPPFIPTIPKNKQQNRSYHTFEIIL